MKTFKKIAQSAIISTIFSFTATPTLANPAAQQMVPPGIADFLAPDEAEIMQKLAQKVQIYHAKYPNLSTKEIGDVDSMSDDIRECFGLMLVMMFWKSAPESGPNQLIEQVKAFRANHLSKDFVTRLANDEFTIVELSKNPENTQFTADLNSLLKSFLDGMKEQEEAQAKRAADLEAQTKSFEELVAKLKAEHEENYAKRHNMAKGFFTAVAVIWVGAIYWISTSR